MSADPDDDELRRSVREQPTNGRLFWASGGSTVRRGTGRPCTVCGKPRARDSVEREIRGPGDRYALTHEDCYRIWREESRRLQSP